VNKLIRVTLYIVASVVPIEQDFAICC